ncbi:hypothetical protein AB0E78_03085 [Streptomyces sp. NPDC032198]|uniref:hypothetical protein n=1 Tax=Streptomyces sp. NPDC032198 TaxID=3155127 RepID=UPI0033E52ADF
MTTPHPEVGDPLDLALVDNAIHRAEGLAVADPTSRLAHEVADELTAYLALLITPAERRLTVTGGGSPAAQRARAVLSDSIQHARAVHHDQLTGAFTNPTASLYLLAGACRLLKNAMVPPW